MKSINEIDENYLTTLCSDPNTFEISMDFKVKYDGDADELRRDIIAFANKERGFLFFGIDEKQLPSPSSKVGVPRKEADGIMLTINEVVNKKCDPHLDPPPQCRAIPISNGNYIVGVEIFPKERGLYGIRRNGNPNNEDFQSYEFWIRNGNGKKQMTMEEVNFCILNFDPYKKRIDVTIDFGCGIAGGTHPLVNHQLLSIQGVNKSIRPIKVTSYGFQIYDQHNKEWYNLFLLRNAHPNTQFNTILPIKLLDGDECKAFYPMDVFIREFVTKKDFIFPIKVRGFVNSNDGVFVSNEKNLEKKDIW